MARRVLAPLALVLLAAAGCGGGSPAPRRAAVPSARTTAPPATTTAPAATTAPTSTESSTACRTDQLHLSNNGTNGAAGHIVVGFALRNVSSSACHTYGYPGVQLVDTAGHDLPTRPTHVTHDLAGPVPLQRVVIAPEATATFRIAYTDVPSGAQTPAAARKQCPMAAGLRVIPPDQTTALSVAVQLVPCRGAMTVSPVEPGDRASATG